MAPQGKATKQSEDTKKIIKSNKTILYCHRIIVVYAHVNVFYLFTSLSSKSHYCIKGKKPQVTQKQLMNILLLLDVKWSVFDVKIVHTNNMPKEFLPDQ